jgi:hypothetical protein
MNDIVYFFGKEGHIIEGEHPGWSIEIVDDTQGETGGYFIVVSDRKPDNPEIFDWWLQKKENIPLFIEDMEWVIEWPDNA